VETTTTSKKQFSKLTAAKSRRERVISRLEQQLKRGLRAPKKTEQTISDVPLMDKDIKRINQELETLRERI
jgi:hypothetical protein